MKVPFYRVQSGKDELKAIEDILSGKSYEAAEDLEAAFEEYVGASYAVATSNGTSALHLAMLAINLKRGDKVLCSVNCAPDVPEVVRHFDAEPAFIDIEEESFLINLDKLEAYLEDNQSKKLKAVIISHVAGRICDLDRLYSIAKLYNVKVVEDATDALGATYNGQKVGSTGADITCFAFSSHLKNSVVNGGMLVSEDEGLIDRVKLLRNHAMTQLDENLEYIYDVTDIGNKYTISEVEAAFIGAQLTRQDGVVARQKEIAAIYREKLKNLDHVQLPSEYENQSCSLFIIKIDKNRDSFARELLKKGIETGLHFTPLHLLSYYKAKYSLRINDFPVALKSYQQILSIPLFCDMSDKEIDYVVKNIKEISQTRI